jgi:predicted sulfurtransferase
MKMQKKRHNNATTVFQTDRTCLFCLPVDRLPPHTTAGKHCSVSSLFTMSDRNRQEVVISEHAKSVAGLPLPVASAECTGGSILLFYQYKEPPWSKAEHKKALKKVLEIAQRHRVTGRGRVAPEGLNCTLTAVSPASLRAFCQELRDWDGDLFNETDFKITDEIKQEKLFKSLSVRKTAELVAYGLDGVDRAPCLKTFAGVHLDAVEYHEAMQDKEAVIIDVRNAYESAIGGFRPPEGGAELIDPRMRNSIEWPKWLNDPVTVKKLNNKKVLMYCTGGIRCERATALLNEMTVVNPNLKPAGVCKSFASALERLSL